MNVGEEPANDPDLLPHSSEGRGDDVCALGGQVGHHGAEARHDDPGFTGTLHERLHILEEATSWTQPRQGFSHTRLSIICWSRK